MWELALIVMAAPVVAGLAYWIVDHLTARIDP